MERSTKRRGGLGHPYPGRLIHTGWCWGVYRGAGGRGDQGYQCVRVTPGKTTPSLAPQVGHCSHVKTGLCGSRR